MRGGELGAAYTKVKSSLVVVGGGGGDGVRPAGMGTEKVARRREGRGDNALREVEEVGRVSIEDGARQPTRTDEADT